MGDRCPERPAQPVATMERYLAGAAIEFRKHIRARAERQREGTAGFDDPELDSLLDEVRAGGRDG